MGYVNADAVSRMKRALRATLLGLGALALSGCALVDQRAAAPAPSLELLQAAAVELAPECTATESMQVAFTVEPNGRTSNVQPSSGPACVQAALREWVSSFQYAPPVASTSASVEWVLVSARR